MIFTGYWEVLVLNFSVMGNTVFFSAKKLMERWYLHGLFELSMIFQDLENMVFRAVPGLTICRTFCKDSILKSLGSIYLFNVFRFKIILELSSFLASKNTEEEKSSFSAIVCTVTFFFRSLLISCEIIPFFFCFMCYSKRFPLWCLTKEL